MVVYMHIKIKGIVLKQRVFLNEQKFVTILTAERSLMRARLKIGGQISRNIFMNVHVLGFYYFNIFEGRFGCVIDSVEVLEKFFDLRYDPKRLALAQYMCELTELFIPSKHWAKRHLNLLLNALWLLSKGKFTCRFIKAVFELKLISISGYMPNLVACKFCCHYKKPVMFYVPSQGFLICLECLKENVVTDKIEVSNLVLHAMRFIIFKDDKDIFKFKLYFKHLKSLSELTQYCVLILLEHEPKTLKIYDQFKDEI